MAGLPSEIVSVDQELASLDGEFTHLAKKRVALLRRKISALDDLLRQRRDIQDQVDRLEAVLSGPQLPPSDQVDTGRPPTAVGVIPGEFATGSVWEAARDLLRRERREMPTGEITASLVAGGRQFKAKSPHPSSQVNSSLSQQKNVFYSKKKRGRMVWGLREWEGEGNEDLRNRG